MHHMRHHLSSFWMIYAITRHPVAGLLALALAAVVGHVAFRGRK